MICIKTGPLRPHKTEKLRPRVLSTVIKYFNTFRSVMHCTFHQSTWIHSPNKLIIQFSLSLSHSKNSNTRPKSLPHRRWVPSGSGCRPCCRNSTAGRTRRDCTSSPDPLAPPWSRSALSKWNCKILGRLKYGYRLHLRLASGPHLASFLKVQNFCTSSKNSPDGHRLMYGNPSTHWKKERKKGRSGVRAICYFVKRWVWSESEN